MGISELPVANDDPVLRARRGVDFPTPGLIDTHEDGVTESWVAQLLCSLLVAHGGTAVCETGGFLGVTSAWLALTLEQMGGGKLYVCEIDQARAETIASRLGGLETPHVRETVVQEDVLRFLDAMPGHSLDFVFVDDDHHPVHVEQEILALWKKVRPGGIIAFHDVAGQTAEIGRLVRKYGGLALDLPKLGPAGGLGVIQLPK